MKNSLFLVALATALATPPIFAAPVKPVERSYEGPQGVWQSVPVATRLQAARAAELDAMRLLTEAIYGVALEGETYVQDFVLASDEVRAATHATLRGAKLGQPDYQADGRVEVVGTIRLREVIVTLKETVRKTHTGGRLTARHKKAIAKMDISTLDRTIEVVGGGALAGSVGQKKLLAKRSAEIAAYRALAERVLGVEVESGTRISDLVVHSDQIRSSMARVLRGAEYVSIGFFPDHSAEVTLKLACADVDRLLRNESLFGARVRPLTPEQARSYFEETGLGAPGGDQEIKPTAGPEPFGDVIAILSTFVVK